MTNLDWPMVTFLVVQVFGALATTLLVGLPRKPVTPTLAAVTWVLVLIFIGLYLVVR